MLGLCCPLSGEEAHLICPHVLYLALSVCLRVTAFNQPNVCIVSGQMFPRTIAGSAVAVWSPKPTCCPRPPLKSQPSPFQSPSEAAAQRS